MDSGRFLSREKRMNSLINNRWVFLLLRVLIGGIFIYAGFTKTQSPLQFADSIATFKVLPIGFINILAIGLPIFEIIAGMMLIAGWQLRAGALAILVLTTIFALALGQALIRGLEVDCGCFGSGKPSLFKTWSAFGRDLLLFAGAMIIYLKCLKTEFKGAEKFRSAVRNSHLITQKKE